MKLLALFLILASLALSACVGNTLSAQAACDSDVSQITSITGECTRTIDTLEEKDTQHLAIQTSDVMPFATVDFTVTVEQGAVDVTFVDSRGNTQTTPATPGHPATGSWPVQLDPLNQIKFDLTPVGGPAQGVASHLSFVCDCLP
ncbi:MAG: hypothetical protein IT317_06930 [Anaerolineales bacterium]|nr:hypothetical protein [Anaerolineales bacterium]